MADELHRAMLEHRGKESVGGLVKRLAAYTRYHFAGEERMMEETGYTGYLAHRRERHVRGSDAAVGVHVSARMHRVAAR
jgi:hemerythrin